MKVEIYGAEWCTFCTSAVKLCETKAIDFDYIDIDEMVNLQALEQRIGTKPRTVPQIFLDGLLIEGGYTGLQRELAKV